MSSSSRHNEDHPVSQIISKILQVVFTNSIQPPPVIELDNDSTTPESPLVIDVEDDRNHSHLPTYTNNNMTDDVAFGAGVVSDSNLANDLAAVPLSPVKLCLQDGKPPPSAEPMAVEAGNIDTGADDDDGIEIVSTAVVQPLTVPKSTAQPILLDSDLEIDECLIASSDSKFPEVDAYPPVNDSISIDSGDESSTEVVVCSLTQSSCSNSAPSPSHPCSNCNSSTTANNTPLSRCKHVLCSDCMLNSIIEQRRGRHANSAKLPKLAATNDKTSVDPQTNLPDKPDKSKPISDRNDQNRSRESAPETSDDTRLFHLCSLPTCIVPRCGAPLNRAEVFSTLALTQSDTFFAPSFRAFEHWLETPPEASNFGPNRVDIPPFQPALTSVTISTGPVNESVAESLPEPHSQTALVPFWAWDEEYSQNGQVGAWLCLVCGKHELDPAPRSNSRPSCTPPNQALPSYPHCAYARALGAVAYIIALENTREGQDTPDLSLKEPKGSRAKAPGATRRKRKSQGSQSYSKRRKTGFAKGTGYAGNRDTDWCGTSLSFLERKSRMDKALTHWLQQIRWFLLIPDDVSLSTWPGFMRCLLKERGFVQHIGAILINESIMDVQERIPVFLAALQVVHAMCDCPALRSLVTMPGDGDGGKTIAELTESLSKQAAVLSTGAGRDGLAQSTVILVKQIRKCIRLINRHSLVSPSQTTKKDLSTVDAQVEEKAVVQHQIPPQSTTGEGNGCVIDEQKDPFENDKEKYVRSMRGVQFQTVAGLAKQSAFYAEATKLEMTSIPSGKRQRRIAGEVASLIPSLPLSWSSTILLRVDEDRYDFLRAVIFGPEETPYDSGAFVFDIWLPLEYPSTPPKFRLLTTGGGRVRFNPNLYACGKVCLSLLGTWSGPSWTPASTILQVLVSIQSLVLVSDPYFNEPGYENHLGTQSGQESSKLYNERVRKDTALYAIQYNIRHPYPELEEGIRLHFVLKKRYVRHFFKRWFSCWEDAHNDNGGHLGVSDASTSNMPEVIPDLTVFPTPIAQANKMALSQLLQPSTPLPPVSLLHSTHIHSLFGPGRNCQKFVMNPSSLRSILADLDGLEIELNQRASYQ